MVWWSKGRIRDNASQAVLHLKSPAAIHKHAYVIMYFYMTIRILWFRRKILYFLANHSFWVLVRTTSVPKIYDWIKNKKNNIYLLNYVTSIILIDIITNICSLDIHVHCFCMYLTVTLFFYWCMKELMLFIDFICCRNVRW